MWSHATYAGEAVTIVLMKGTSAKFYRYFGASQIFYEATKYKGHSVSPDGNILAIFEGEDTYTSVTIYDLYGTRAKSFCIESS